MSSAVSLEGASCADLPPQIADKYFGANANTERFLVDVAKMICRRCVAQPECLDMALSGPARKIGVVGGVTVNELNAARTWLSYEHGLMDHPPKRAPRPAWLPMSEAAQEIEQLRTEEVVEL